MEPDFYAPAPLETDTKVTVASRVQRMKVIARLRRESAWNRLKPRSKRSFWRAQRAIPSKWRGSQDGRMMVEPLQRHLTGDDRKPLYILIVSVAAVLLVACAKVANLQLARAVSRRHETALRGALGASRLRLLRQFLVESLILASLAGAFGLALAFIATSVDPAHGDARGHHEMSLHHSRGCPTVASALRQNQCGCLSRSMAGWWPSRWGLPC